MNRSYIYLFLSMLLAILSAAISSVPLFAATPTVTVDLADNPVGVTRVLGSTGDGRYGVPVCGGYDCNGDGFNDVAFSAMLASPFGRSSAGQIHLVFGDGTIGGLRDTATNPPNILRIIGAQPFELAGSEIWMDDVTGDGLGDLIICRQNFTADIFRQSCGAVTIISGSAQLSQLAQTGGLLDLSNPPFGIRVANIYGLNAYDRFGIWARTGDVNGDGIADLVVGADQEDLSGEENNGAAYLFIGGGHLFISQTVDLTLAVGTLISGRWAKVIPPVNSSFFHLGGTVQIADLDGNGKGEVILTAAINRAGASLVRPGTPAFEVQSSGGAPNGRVYILWDDIWPSVPFLNGDVIDLGTTTDTNLITVIQGDIDNETFGEEILGGFDLDNDGKADLFSGDLAADGLNGVNSGIGHIFFDAAQLKGLSFALSDPVLPAGVEFTRIDGPLAGSIGADTALHGDFNGDGIDDIALGNPHDEPLSRISAGSVHVLYGRAGAWPASINLATGMLPASIDTALILGAKGTVGSNIGDTLCYSAAAGDINGDGVMDFIMNEMVGDGALEDDVGNLLIIDGSSLLSERPNLLGFGPDFSSGGFDLQFQSRSGMLYRLQASPGLNPSAWSNISGPIVGLPGSTTTPLGPQGPAYRFFRIQRN